MNDLEIAEKMKAMGFWTEYNKAYPENVYHGVFKKIDPKEVLGNDGNESYAFSNNDYTHLVVSQDAAAKLLANPTNVAMLENLRITPAPTQKNLLAITMQIDADRKEAEESLKPLMRNASEDALQNAMQIIAERKGHYDGKLDEKEIAGARELYKSLYDNDSKELQTSDLLKAESIGLEALILAQQYALDLKKSNYPGNRPPSTPEDVNKRPLSDIDPAVKDALSTIQGLRNPDIRLLKEVPETSMDKQAPKVSGNTEEETQKQK